MQHAVLSFHQYVHGDGIRQTPLSTLSVCRISSSLEAFDAPHPAAVVSLAFVDAVMLFRRQSLPEGMYYRMGWTP